MSLVIVAAKSVILTIFPYDDTEVIIRARKRRDRPHSPQAHSPQGLVISPSTSVRCVPSQCK